MGSIYLTRWLSRDNISSPRDLDFGVLEEMFQMAHILMMENNGAIFVLKKKKKKNRRTYGPDKNLTYKCDFDLDLNECFKWYIYT